MIAESNFRKRIFLWVSFPKLFEFFSAIPFSHEISFRGSTLSFLGSVLLWYFFRSFIRIFFTTDLLERFCRVRVCRYGNVCVVRIASFPRRFFCERIRDDDLGIFAKALIQVLLRTGNILVRRILISIAGSSSANKALRCFWFLFSFSRPTFSTLVKKKRRFLGRKMKQNILDFEYSVSLNSVELVQSMLKNLSWKVRIRRESC